MSRNHKFDAKQPYQWISIHTYTDNTFRLNYNGAGADEVTINSNGDVSLLQNLITPEDKKIFLEGDADDDYNAIWKDDAENALMLTSRFRIANIIDSNNDDTDSFWSVRHNGAILQDLENSREFKCNAASELVDKNQAMLDIIGNSSTGANCIRIVDGAETGHGSHPAKNRAWELIIKRCKCTPEDLLCILMTDLVLLKDSVFTKMVSCGYR